MVKVLSAKLPEALIDSLGMAAESRGVSRNRLVREALEAAVEGRIPELTEKEREERRRLAFRDGLARDRVRLKAALVAGNLMGTGHRP